MEKIEIPFDKEKIAVFEKLSNTLLRNMTFESGRDADDFVQDLLTYRLTADIYANLAEQIELNHYCPRPKFLDWLFRRKKVVKFKLDVKDLLINPPPDGVERIYVTKQL